MTYQINQQEPQRVERDAAGRLFVHSIFKTIQGEGPYAGRAALFVRLHGCNLQCPGCDTEYTSVKMALSPAVLLNIIFCEHNWKSGLVVITGGEPFRQNITPLVVSLKQFGYEVQVETNGVLYPGDDFPWQDVTVVCSPKTGKIHPETAKRVHAYKYVLSAGGTHTDGLPRTALGHPLQGHYQYIARPPVGWRGPIYIQPMDVKDEHENAKNMQAVVDAVMEHPDKHYIMGVQFHKAIGLP